MNRESQMENLAPRAQCQEEKGDVGDHFKHRSPAKIRTAAAFGRIRTRLTNLAHLNDECSHSSQLARDTSSPLSSEEEMFQWKMQVLLKNPSIFRVFKAYLAENEMSHSKEGMCRLLHDFFDNNLRMPELREDIAQLTAAAVPVPERRRHGFLAYLAGESSSSSASSKLQERTLSFECKPEGKNVLHKSIFAPNPSPIIGTEIPHLETTDSSWSESDNSLFDQCSMASF